MNIIRKQIVGFFFAGCSANVVSFIVYIFFYKTFNFSIMASSISGQCLGVLTNYAINSRIVFKKSLGLKKKFIYGSYYALSIYFVGLFIIIFSGIYIHFRERIIKNKT